MDGRGRDQLTEITNPAAMHQQNANNNSVQDSGRTSSVQLQLIPSSTAPTALSMSSSAASVAATTATLTNHSRLMVHNNAISVIGGGAVHQQQQHQQLQLSSNNSNSSNCVAMATGAHIVNHRGNNRSTNTANSNSNAGHGNDTNNSNICVGSQMIAITSNGDGGCNKTNAMNLTNIDGLQQQQQQQHSGSNSIATNQNQQQIDNINRSLADTHHNNHHNVLSQRPPSVSATNRMVSNAPIVTSAPPLVLSLSQVSLEIIKNQKIMRINNCPGRRTAPEHIGQRVHFERAAATAAAANDNVSFAKSVPSAPTRP